MSERLFCKPLPGIQPSEILFYLANKQAGNTIAFRSLDLQQDIPVIHDWVNQPYAKRFWQMNMDLRSLVDHYTTVIENPLAHSFIGLFNNNIVCQVDCYQVAADELSKHVAARDGACGLHILLCPPRQLIKDLSENMLKAFIKFYFSFSPAEILYGEPDSNNQPANSLAIKVGMQFQKTIQLSYKTANLYSITREQFFQP